MNEIFLLVTFATSNKNAKNDGCMYELFLLVTCYQQEKFMHSCFAYLLEVAKVTNRKGSKMRWLFQCLLVMTS